MTEKRILDRLTEMGEAPYAAFQRKLIPTLDEDRVIGVRTPGLKKLARELAGSEEGKAFLCALPHRYFDENQLHAFLISEERDFDACMARVEAFLPWVDNWATCDQLSPRAFEKNRAKLLPCIEKWIESPHVYTVRFGVDMLMRHFLDRDFSPVYLDWAAGIGHEDYYVKMAVAWYFATALSKQYEAALPYVSRRVLPLWTHNKTSQKAVESRRLTEAQKAELRRFRITEKARVVK